MSEGNLFYFAVVEWVPLLSLPALTHDHAGADVKADEKVRWPPSELRAWDWASTRTLPRSMIS